MSASWAAIGQGSLHVHDPAASAELGQAKGRFKIEGYRPRGGPTQQGPHGATQAD
jgi:hypothetical protein